MSTPIYVSSAKAYGCLKEKEVFEECTNVASYLDSHSSADVYDWEFGLHRIGSTDGSIRNFLHTLLTEIENDPTEADLTHGETVLVPHEETAWGYGGNRAFDINGKRIHGAVVYAGIHVPAVETRIMTWHEAGHTWTFPASGEPGEHGKATADYSGDDLYDITPMAASYVRGTHSRPYMQWGAERNPPQEFCDGTDNFQGVACWGCHYSGCWDYSRYSYCVHDDFEEWRFNRI